jgi:hypothetical protein
MQELTPVLLIAGFTVGSLSAFLPAKLWLNHHAERFDVAAFKQQFPQRKWVPSLFQVAPLVWLAFYGFFLFPYYFSWFGQGQTQIYFLMYFFVAGIGLCDGMLEIATKTAPGRGFLGRALQLRSLVYGQSVRQFGLLHIGLIAGMAVLSWLVLILILP